MRPSSPELPEVSDLSEVSAEEYYANLQRQPLIDILVALMLINDLFLFVQDRLEVTPDPSDETPP